MTSTARMPPTSAATETVLASPVGPLRLVASEDGLTAVEFSRATPDRKPPENTLLRLAVEQLNAYFDGRLRDFELPLAPQGSEFQRRVWQELRSIPYGTTASYADIAVRIGSPVSASRAIGLANGANPHAIVVPCHRVIGSDGSLVGYGGGLPRKRFLLALESPAVQEHLFGD